MRLLIIHHESVFWGGAEKLLGYFLQELAQTDVDVTVALVAESQVPNLVPAGMKRLAIPAHPGFSLLAFSQQVWRLMRAHLSQPFDVIHGWAARDWELAAFMRCWSRRPALGTLHDHPQARFISLKRQHLMRWAARWLKTVVCVSDAVRQACASAGYAPERLRVIHNGLPFWEMAARRQPSAPFCLGFLGVFSERKGLADLFATLDELSRLTSIPWELKLAGQAQDESGQRLVRDIQDQYRPKAWWPRVQWLGWAENPMRFLEAQDLLICPSCEFEPFGLVICEAALTGAPTLAARQGGIAEIIQDGQTGWLFEPGDHRSAARLLVDLLEHPTRIRAAGELAHRRVQREFDITKMVAAYQKLYSTLTGCGNTCVHRRDFLTTF
jgi:glycosyltransferase involved in cell wall biosynthesis